MKIWKKNIDLETVSNTRKDTIVDLIGIEFTTVGDDFLCGKMPVDERTKQPYGILHGGASCVLAETVGSVAANFCVEDGFVCVGLSINTNHIKKVRDGFVYAKAMPVHLGKTTQVWDTPIKDEAGQLISITRLTLAVIAI